MLRDWLSNQSSGGEKNCIVYSLFCIFVFIIIIIIIIIPFFVVFLNCLYLNRLGGWGQQAAVWCLVAGCWVKP